MIRDGRDRTVWTVQVSGRKLSQCYRLTSAKSTSTESVVEKLLIS